MADYESAPSELSTAIGSDHSGLAGRLSEILGDAIQALIEDELTARIGAEPGQRSSSRLAQRNGHRPKLISTPGGDVAVGIPKLRQGLLRPSCSSPVAASTRRSGRWS